MALSFASFVNAAPARTGGQAYARKKVVIHNGCFVVVIISSPIEPDLICARTNIDNACSWNQSTKSWTQLLAWMPHDNWTWTDVENTAIDLVNPNIIYLAVGTYTLDRVPPVLSVTLPTMATHPRAVICSPSLAATCSTAIWVSIQRFPPRKAGTLFLGIRSGNGLPESTNYGATRSKIANLTDIYPIPYVYVQRERDVQLGKDKHHNSIQLRWCRHVLPANRQLPVELPRSEITCISKRAGMKNGSMPALLVGKEWLMSQSST
ncbi:MAG: hypothetical protein JXB30_04575 [Anaerolineae bacterium]|nr:hypothetical protein [Anaerolineae bacterium]